MASSLSLLMWFIDVSIMGPFLGSIWMMFFLGTTMRFLLIRRAFFTGCFFSLSFFFFHGRRHVLFTGTGLTSSLFVVPLVVGVEAAAVVVVAVVVVAEVVGAIGSVWLLLVLVLMTPLLLPTGVLFVVLGVLVLLLLLTMTMSGGATVVAPEVVVMGEVATTELDTLLADTAAAAAACCTVTFSCSPLTIWTLPTEVRICCGCECGCGAAWDGDCWSC